MRSSKIILIVMMVLLTILFSSGCISDEYPPTDSVIVLNDQMQTFTVKANTDNKEATWSIDGVDKETVPVSGGLVMYTLNYKDLKIGEHILKLTDSDESVEWKISVSNEPTNGQGAGIISTNNSRGYDRNTPWDERHRIARERINASKI